MSKKLILFGLPLFLIFAACEKKKPVQVPTPIVKAAVAEKKDVPFNIEVPAKITGSLEVQVRAQVGGILRSRTYEEGKYIKEGTKLFEIDKGPYEAALTRAQGSLGQAQSELKRTSRDFERMKKLHASKAISQKEYDDSLSSYERAEANLKVAEGALHEAEINLGYTDVTAPISGIVNKEAQSVGSLISPNGDSSLLTSMVAICPLHANFSVSGSLWAALAKKYRNGKLSLAEKDDFKIEIIMADGTVYPHYGKIIFVDSNEDNQTSSVSIKAEVPSTENQRVLLPGQFVRAKIIGAEYKDAIVVPATSLISTQSGFVVYVIKEDNVVEVRPVKAEIVENRAVIQNGLNEGEVVVSEGIVKVKPGEAVIVSSDNQE